MADKRKLQQIIRELEKHNSVSSVRVISTDSGAKPGADEVSLASEASLAKDWLSSADDHWDTVYKNLCTRKAM